VVGDIGVCDGENHLGLAPRERSQFGVSIKNLLQINNLWNLFVEPYLEFQRKASKERNESDRKNEREKPYHSCRGLL
jgi:hypothetical protein